ncbi:MAG: AAA family ATPase [bacterium]
MIIGITGTNGAGKGTIVEYLINTKKFAHYAVRAFLTEELKKKDLAVDRSAMRDIANELRREHGPSYVVEALLEKAGHETGDVVVESIRTVGEAELLKSKGALLWAVDAEREERYQRVLKRWSETDKVSFEQFCEYEDREMQSTEAWDMNVFAVMGMADHVFTNNGTQAELFAQVEEALKGVNS